MKNMIEISPDGPIRTPGEALLAARKSKGETLLRFRGGVYPLTQTIVLTAEDSHTRWVAAPGETVVFSGGIRIENWKETEVHGKRAWTVQLEKGRLFRGLWANDERRERARFPKTGRLRFTGTEKHTPRSSMHDGPIKANFESGTFRNFHNIEDVEVQSQEWWNENHFRIRSVDEAKNEVTFHKRAARSLRGEDNAFARYIVCNVYEELTEPGEWYYDRKSGVLTYLPKSDEIKEKTAVYVSELGELLRIQGTPAAPAEDIRFENVAFQHCGWTMPEDMPDSFQAASNIPACITLSYARECVFFRCDIAHTTNTGIRFNSGAKKNIAAACRIRDVGASGITIMAEKTDVPLSELPGETDVIDCRIVNGGQDHQMSCGVLIGNSFGNRLLHNEIAYFNYTGVSLGWLWGFFMEKSAGGHNLIEYNHIHHINPNLLSDNGGFYSLGPQVGSTVIGNSIHDVGCYYYGGRGIYLDEGSMGMTIRNNRVKDAIGTPFTIHFAKFNDISSNVFYGAKDGLASYGRADRTYCNISDRNLFIVPKNQTTGKYTGTPASFRFRNTLIAGASAKDFPGCTEIPLASEEKMSAEIGFVPLETLGTGVRAVTAESFEDYDFEPAPEYSFVESAIDGLTKKDMELTFKLVIRNTGSKRISGKYLFSMNNDVSFEKIRLGEMDFDVNAGAAKEYPVTLQLQPEHIQDGTHQCWLEAAGNDTNIFSCAEPFFFPPKTRIIPAYENKQPAKPAKVLPLHVEDDEHHPMFDGYACIEGDSFHIEGHIFDPKVQPNLSTIWDGSVVEIYFAEYSGAPVVQYGMLPPHDGLENDIRPAILNEKSSPEDLHYHAKLMDVGWYLTLDVPLKKRGLKNTGLCFDITVQTSGIILMHPYERKPMWGSNLNYANSNELAPLIAEKQNGLH